MAPDDSASNSRKFNYVADGNSRVMSRSFFRGDTANYMPHRADMEKAAAIIDHVLTGWMPVEPFIGPQTNVVAFGSCFAANIGRYLTGLGFNVPTQREGRAYVQRVSDGLVNVFAIAQQFEWAWENRVPSVELWHGWKAEDYGYDEEVRLATRQLFDEADVFILTLGLSEIWYDEPTGEVFWRAVPEDKFDPERHKFRVATPQETLDKLRDICRLIRAHRPQARIVFTLSPVGLAATFRPIPAFSANSVSKAILRTAIDLIYSEARAHDANLYYFPSYEMVLHGFRNAFRTDLRHPHPHALEANMKAFERYFCATELGDEGLREALANSIEMDRKLASLSAEQEAAMEIAWAQEWHNAQSVPGDASKDIVRQRRQDEREARKRERQAERDRRILERGRNQDMGGPD